LGKGNSKLQINGQFLFKGEIITKMQKMGWCHLKIFFSRTTEAEELILS
jgi:hypothetical protein